MSWIWAAASTRGTSHIRNNTRCQDAQACRAYGADRETFFAVVADGAGSAEFGGEGASVVCRAIECCAREHFRDTDILPDETIIGTWVDLARDRLAIAAQNRGVPRRQFASTLLVAIARGTELVTAHIGDGAIVYRGEPSDVWHIGSWPAHGEYVNTTRFLTDDPEPALRFNRVSDTIRGLALFTDGIERLVLDFSTLQAHAPFFQQMLAPIGDSIAVGRDPVISRMIARFLDSAQVNDRTDDDKTLVLAAFK